MTTGIANEWDPGDPPNIHAEVTKACPACGELQYFKAMTEGMEEDFYWCDLCDEEFR